VFTHVPLQLVSPEGQEHALALQTVPPWHVVPQVPQLLLSFAVSTQEFDAAQYVGYEAFAHDGTQLVPLHAVVPFVGLVQTAHDGPQALALLATHEPPQRFVPAAHWHMLSMHCSPPVHFSPQPLQLLASLVVSTHAPEQSVNPLLHETPHTLFAHVACP
jgi:hypothetical protein